jgi:hypothetical protein
MNFPLTATHFSASEDARQNSLKGKNSRVKCRLSSEKVAHEEISNCSIYEEKSAKLSAAAGFSVYTMRSNPGELIARDQSV